MQSLDFIDKLKPVLYICGLEGDCMWECKRISWKTFIVWYSSCMKPRAAANKLNDNRIFLPCLLLVLLTKKVQVLVTCNLVKRWKIAQRWILVD